MISVGVIKGSDRGRVEYYLARAALCEEHETKAAARDALADYYAHDRMPGEGAAERYAGRPNGPGQWMGRGAQGLGLAGRPVAPEAFAAAVLDGNLDGVARGRARPVTNPAGLVAAEPLAAAIRAAAKERGVEPAVLFPGAGIGQTWARVERSADRFGQVPATLVQQLASRVPGMDPAGLYGGEEYRRAVAMAQPDRNVDNRTAALDVVFSAPKSVSLLYALGDELTRATVLEAQRHAVGETLEHLDRLAAVGVRGSKRHGTVTEIGTGGLVAAAFVHDEARPTAGCGCGDPQLHTHAVVMNLAHGVDGAWSAIQHDRVKPNATTAGYLYQAQLRHTLSQQLGVRWRAPVSGLAEITGFADAQLRAFSKRRAEIEDTLTEVGESGYRAAQAATLASRQAKLTMPEGERLDYWRAEAAGVGIALDRVLGHLSREGDPVAGGDGPEYIADLLDRLTTQASSFTRRDLLRALAADARDGADRQVIEERADAILAAPDLAVALGRGEGGLTTADVRRGRGGATYAYAVEQKWSTPEQLAREARLVDAAAARVAEGCARLSADQVRDVCARQPLELSAEQADAVTSLTTTGAGVSVLQAGAGSGKTSAVLSTVRQAYESAGYRVTGACASAKAARVLAADAGMRTQTIARLLLDLDRGEGPGVRSVLVLDEASMIGTRDLARILDAAGQNRAKVLVVGDTRQLASVDAGGGMRGLTDRLGAATLTANRRQRAAWERTAVADLAEGRTVDALRAYVANDRVTVTDSAAAARRLMVAGWWADVQQLGPERTLMVAVRNVDRDQLNRLARQVMADAGRLGEQQLAAAGREYAAGDRVILLRNDRSHRYDNGDTATVLTIEPGRGLTVRLDRGGVQTLSAGYLDAGHVDHAYAGTVYKAQGSSVETAHTLGTGLFREDGHVALSRGRAVNRLYLVQGEPEAEIDLPTQRDRDALRQALDTLGQSREKRLATDTAVWGADADQLRHTLHDAARLLRNRPVDDTARLPALRAQLERLTAQVTDARTRLETMQAEAAQAPSGLRARITGRRTEAESLTHRIERQAGVCGRLEQQLTSLRNDVAAVERGDTTRSRWTDHHTPDLQAAAAAGRELTWRTRAEQLARTATGPDIARIRDALTPTRTRPVQPAERQPRPDRAELDVHRHGPPERHGPSRGLER